MVTLPMSVCQAWIESVYIDVKSNFETVSDDTSMNDTDDSIKHLEIKNDF